MNRIKNKLREWLFDDYWFRENFAKQIEFYMNSYVRDWISSNPEIIAPLIIKLITKEIKIKLKNKKKQECACEIHLRNKPDEYCLGHGKNCVCSKKKPKHTVCPNCLGKDGCMCALHQLNCASCNKPKPKNSEWEKIYYKSGFINIGRKVHGGWEHTEPVNPNMYDEIIKTVPIENDKCECGSKDFICLDCMI